MSTDMIVTDLRGRKRHYTKAKRRDDGGGKSARAVYHYLGKSQKNLNMRVKGIRLTTVQPRISKRGGYKKEGSLNTRKKNK